MSSIAHFTDGGTIVWRLSDFEQRLAAAIPNDRWAGDFYEYTDPTHGRVLLQIRLVPKSNQGECGLCMSVLSASSDFSMDAKCEAWLEKIDGTTSERKMATCLLERNDHSGWIVLCTPDEMAAFCHAPTVFVCVRLPFQVSKTGSIRDLSTLHRWDIPDFQQRFNTAVLGQQWTGNEFAADGLLDVKWRLSFYPKGDVEQQTDHTGLSLRLVDLGDRSSASLQASMWIERAGTKRTQKCTSNYEFTEPTGGRFFQFATQEELCAFVNGGPIVVCCEVRPLGPPVEISPLEIQGLLLARSFNDPTTSNAKITVGDRSFHVLSSVLFDKSPVLMAMLEPKLNGAQKAELMITGHEPDVVEAMLRSFYTGEVEDLDSLATRLLPLADYYELDRLHAACTASILDQLSVERALEHLLLTFRHDQDGDFKRRVLEFAHENRQKIMDFPDWAHFKSENPEIRLALDELLD